MYAYLILHEAYVLRILAGDVSGLDLDRLQEFHLRQVSFMQHERLIHLLVMLATGLFFLLTTGFVLALGGGFGVFCLWGILLVLTAFYVQHYFRLENGVQRLYHLANQITVKSGKIGAIYDQK